MAIQNPYRLRRGLESNRTGITPLEGELVYTTDEKKVYVGDGSTAGGVLIGPSAGSSLTGISYVDGSAYNVSAENPTNWWNLNETSGNLADSVGSQTATMTNTPTYNVTGIGGTAVTFSGVQYAQTTGTFLSGVASVQVEFWFKSTSTNLQMSIFDTSSDTNVGIKCLLGGTILFGSAGKLGFGVGTAAYTVGVATTSTFNDGNWHHVVCELLGDGSTITSSQMKIYVDGVSQSLSSDSYGGSSSTPLTTSTAMIAGNQYGGGGNFVGTLDEIAVYTGINVLSAQDISNHYSAGLGDSYLVTTVPFDFTDEVRLNGSAGTSGQVLTSQGSGVDPVWTTPATFPGINDTATGTVMYVADTYVSATVPIVGTVVGAGVQNTTPGALFAYGAGTGSANGGVCILETPVDYQTAFDKWEVKAFQDDLIFQTNDADTTFVTKLIIEADGTLSVPSTTNYETLVTADDDIPNKKYVDDTVAVLSGGTLSTELFAVKAYNSANQSIASNATTTISLDTTEFDTDAVFNTTTDRFQPSQPGYYSVNYNNTIDFDSLGNQEKLLLSGLDTSDSSTSTQNITNFGCTINTATPKFTSSIEFDTATPSYLLIDDTGSADFDFGASDFTIDFWVKFNTLTEPAHFFWKSGHPTTTGGFGFYIYANGNITFGRPGVNEATQVASGMTTGTWYHVALCGIRNGTWTVYVNGVAKTTGSITNYEWHETAQTVIGGSTTTNGWTYDGTLDGQIEDYRITKGTALWTSGFTPSSTKLVNENTYEFGIRKNGTKVAKDISLHNKYVTDVFSDDISTVVYLNGSTDYVDVYNECGNYISGNLLAGADQTSFTAIRAQAVAGSSFGTSSFVYTATASQTLFTGLDDNGVSLSYSPNSVNVYKNGVLLTTSDYTATDGTSITLTQAASLDDVIFIQTFITQSQSVSSGEVGIAKLMAYGAI